MKGGISEHFQKKRTSLCQNFTKFLVCMIPERKTQISEFKISCRFSSTKQSAPKAIYQTFEKIELQRTLLFVEDSMHQYAENNPDNRAEHTNRSN